MAGPASTTPYAEALAAVAALAGPPAWLHAVTSPERVTEALRRQLAPVGVTVEGARTERVRVKGGRWTVRCLATLGGGDDALATVALTGTVSPPGGAAAAPETAAAGGLADHPPGTARPGLVPGTRLRLPDLGLDLAVVEPEAPDPELPVVPDLLDHGRAAVLLARALGARAPARLEVLEAWVLRQKLGSRCTVGYRIGPVCDGVPDRVVAKAYADDTGERCYAAMTALTVARHGFLAEPLGYLPEERVLLQGWVDGDTTLKELLQRSLSAGDPTVAVAAETGLVRTGRALSHLHRGVASYAPARPYAAALARVRAELAEASATAPELAAGLGPVLDALAEVDLRHPPGAPVPSHGSFRPAQVLVGGSGVTVIDLDAAGLAEPGADLGTFLGGLDSLGVSDLEAAGDLPRGALQRRARLLDDLGSMFLAGYGRVDRPTLVRTQLWQGLELVTSVLHAWTHGRPAGADSRSALLRHHLARSSAVLASDGVLRQGAVQLG